MRGNEKTNNGIAVNRQPRLWYNNIVCKDNGAYVYIVDVYARARKLYEICFYSSCAQLCRQSK